jgi:very-short-patch-repair endonuclease
MEATPCPAGKTKQATAGVRKRAIRLASGQAHVLCRRQLREAKIPRWILQLEVRAGRWQRTGAQTVVVHNGTLSEATRRTAAVFETGPRAALDGVSALQHRGVSAAKDTQVHVIAPPGSHPVRTTAVVVHESRRFREEDVEVVGGARVVRPAVASVHAALWARTDRQATFFLLLAVQQRLADAAALADAASRVRRHVRRRLLLRVAGEVAGGVRSLGELDVAEALRERGLPEPDRQVLRRRKSGTEYLDARFDRYGLTLEVDGVQHEDLDQRIVDVLRDFALIADGDGILRLPLAVFWVARERVLDALEQVFLARGWRRPAA